MPNRDGPHGFRPIGNLNGDHGCPVHYYALDAANPLIGIGDPVVTQASGFVTKAAATPAVGTVLGIAAEPKAANAGGEIAVWDDPATIYEAQTDDTVGLLTAQSGMFLNANWLAGVAVGGVSIFEIDESTGATTPTLPLKILGLYKVVGNAFGQFNRLRCILNPSVMKGDGSTGI